MKFLAFWAKIASVNMTDSVTQPEAEKRDRLIRPHIELRDSLWREVQKAAIDQGISAREFVAIVLAEKLELPAEVSGAKS